jgi:hypothetical protein
MTGTPAPEYQETRTRLLFAEKDATVDSRRFRRHD